MIFKEEKLIVNNIMAEESKNMTGIRNILIEELKTLKSMKEVFDFIEEKEPNWVLYICDSFSNDYPHLIQNWNYVSRELKIPCEKILLVNGFDTDTRLIFSDLLFSTGFLLRDIKDYDKCEVCNNVLPKQEMYQFMKTKLAETSKIPQEWSSKCTNC